jgi:tRNA splicing ligase
MDDYGRMSLLRSPGGWESVSHVFLALVSYNFKRGAFWKNIWGATTLSARRLFLADDRRIVAHAYDKFFNLGNWFSEYLRAYRVATG